MNKILFLLMTVMAICTQAQNVLRGPYLQQSTDQSIRVKWRTDVATQSKIWYGLSPNNFTDSIYTSSLVSNHEILITGLSPFTKYYYKIGNANGVIAQANTMFFKTNPVIGTEQPIRIWAIGDFGKGTGGQSDVAQSYLNYLNKEHSDVWMWLGDHAYNDGTDAEYQAKVFNMYDTIFNFMTFWPTPGNHDYNSVTHSFGLISQYSGPYYDIISAPENAEAGGLASTHEAFYSYDYGNVHFISLNSELSYKAYIQGNGPMKTWLANDLAQNTQPWTIAYFHQPPYSKGSHDSDDFFEIIMKDMRESLNPIFDQYDVDLVICGHSHVYERSYPIKGHYGVSSTLDTNTMIVNSSNGNPDNGNRYIKYEDYANCGKMGTVYAVVGNSGSVDVDPDLNHPVMAAVSNQGEMGSLVLEVNGDTLIGKYLRANGVIGDKFQMVNRSNCNTTSNEESISSLIDIYPNPFSDHLKIAIPNTITGNVKVEIFDVSTRKVFEKTYNSMNFINIQTEHFKKGTYLMNITVNQQLINYKLIKQ